MNYTFAGIMQWLNTSLPNQSYTCQSFAHRMKIWLFNLAEEISLENRIKLLYISIRTVIGQMTGSEINVIFCQNVYI